MRNRLGILYTALVVAMAGGLYLTSTAQAAGTQQRVPCDLTGVTQIVESAYDLCGGPAICGDFSCSNGQITSWSCSCD